MKRNFGYVLSIALFTLLFTILCVSCSKEQQTPGTNRLTETKRVITINNNIGVNITSGLLKVANSETIIWSFTPAQNSFEYEIPKSFNSDLNIEVELIDVDGIHYARSFYVPLNTNTEAPITASNIISRVIIIENKTGNDIKNYEIKITDTGASLITGNYPENSLKYVISKTYDKNQNIEVGLVDEFGKVYAKTQEIPLKAITGMPITEKERINEGLLKNKWKDLVEWFNKNK